MNILNLFSSVIKPVFDGVFQWKTESNKMEISRQEFELMKKRLEADIEVRLAEEMRKPESEFRQFMLNYEGAASEQSDFMKNFRSSVRPVITYWSLIIITLVMFGTVSGSELKSNLDAIPEPLWNIFLAIFGFWFGGRAVMQIAEAWKQGDTDKQAVVAEARVTEEKIKIERIKAEAEVLQAQNKKAKKEESTYLDEHDFWGGA